MRRGCIGWCVSGVGVGGGGAKGGTVALQAADLR